MTEVSWIRLQRGPPESSAPLLSTVMFTARNSTLCAGLFTEQLDEYCEFILSGIKFALHVPR